MADDSSGLPAPPADWDSVSKTVHLINRVSRLLARIGDSRLRVFGFSVGQLPVLVALKNGAALPQKELAQIAQVEQPSMAQILARMERDGLIQRVPDADDKRSSLITLTDSARERLPEARRVLFQGHGEALSDFTDDEIATFTALLSRVIHNLENTVKSSSL